MIDDYPRVGLRERVQIRAKAAQLLEQLERFRVDLLAAHARATLNGHTIVARRAAEQLRLLDRTEVLAQQKYERLLRKLEDYS